YGISPAASRGVRALGKRYALDSPSDARVWTSEPEIMPAGTKPPGKGRPTANPKPAPQTQRGADRGGAPPGGAGARPGAGAGGGGGGGGVGGGGGGVGGGGVGGRAGGAAGGGVVGPGAGGEGPPEPRPARGAVAEVGRGPGEAVGHRAGHLQRPGGVRAGRVR